MSEKKTIVWMEVVGENRTELQEEIFNGPVNKAIELAVEVTKKAGFLLGQILAHDGKVLASIAKNGIHIND